MVSPVIDLSHHNPTPDWKALKNGGVIAVIHKASEGTSYKDTTYDARRQAATSAGLLWSSYHFLKGSEISKQMDWFLKVVNPVEGERLVIDHETDATLDQLCQAVTYLWSKRPDLQLTIYSGHTIKDQLGTSKADQRLANTSLWIAQYTSASAPSWPKQQWPNWSLWQWTDKESVPGISQPVDGNKWNGSSESLVRFMSPTSSQPEPEPQPETQQIEVALTLPPGVSALVTINGRAVAVS